METCAGNKFVINTTHGRRISSIKSTRSNVCKRNFPDIFPVPSFRKDGRSAEQTGKKRYQGNADEGDTAAGHQLLHAFSIILWRFLLRYCRLCLYLYEVINKAPGTAYSIPHFSFHKVCILSLIAGRIKYRLQIPAMMKTTTVRIMPIVTVPEVIMPFSRVGSVTKHI